MAEIFRSVESNREFDSLYRKGFIKKILGTLKNYKNRLLPLNQIKDIIGTGEEHHLGVKTVEVDKIIGSENRFEDFDRAFLPLNKFNRRKWTSIRSYYEQHESLPIISLYKIGDYYFIRDGHNRVSVAKNSGQLYIDAEVIEITIPKIQFNSSSPEKYFLALEEHVFREKTGLQNIQITLPGGYREIIKLIQCFQCSECPNNQMAREQCSNKIPWEIAVQQWYQNCYSPATEKIEKSGIMKQFKNRTLADLYLWFLFNAEVLRKAACFIPSHSHRKAIRKKPQNFLFNKNYF
ncbi:MAG: hypothetical protein GX428_07170 [Candidatus Atribacteria bacterium]|nr:hypothetical protein [Candidatus Atribacteria bacterium]